MLRSIGPNSQKVDNESVEKRRADLEIINMVKCKLEVGSVLNMKETLPTTLLLFSEKEEVNYKRSLKNQVIENKSSLNPLINCNQNK